MPDEPAQRGGTYAPTLETHSPTEHVTGVDTANLYRIIIKDSVDFIRQLCLVSG